MSIKFDKTYGSCIPPSRMRPHEHEQNPISLTELNEETGEALSKYMKAVADHSIGTMIHNIFGMLWLIDNDARIHFCVEEVRSLKSPSVATFFPRASIKLPRGYYKLGHPSLLPNCKKGDLAAKRARLAGDIVLDPLYEGKPTWLITRSSGRYGSRSDFKFDWLIAVAAKFKENGVELVPFDEWEEQQ